MKLLLLMVYYKMLESSARFTLAINETQNHRKECNTACHISELNQYTKVISDT